MNLTRKIKVRHPYERGNSWSVSLSLTSSTFDLNTFLDFKCLTFDAQIWIFWHDTQSIHKKLGYEMMHEEIIYPKLHPYFIFLRILKLTKPWLGALLLKSGFLHLFWTWKLWNQERMMIVLKLVITHHSSLLSDLTLSLNITISITSDCFNINFFIMKKKLNKPKIYFLI